MYALYQVDDRCAQITLPVIAPVAPPWGWPTSVYLLKGDSPALVDTGHASARDALIEALRTVGVRPDDIRRVLLTGHSPVHRGNIDLFRNATVVSIDSSAASADAFKRDWCDAVGPIFRSLKSMDGAPDAWDQVSWDDVVDAFFEGQGAPAVEELHVEDGALVGAASLQLDAIHVPGVERAACAYFANGTGHLFAGRTLYFLGTPELRDMDAGIRSIDRLAQLNPSAVCPMLGPVERQWFPNIRGYSLQVHGALSNLPYAFAGPTSAVDLAITDIGRVPDDLVRFAHRVHWMKGLMDELVRSGVVEREGDDVFAKCHGGTAQGSRSARLGRFSP